MVYLLAKQDKRIFFVGSDLGEGTLQEFKTEMPDRFLMEGISEANLISISAGLALEGKIVYANTIATFITRRCFEQVALDLCLHNVPVRLIGNGGGLVYAPLGPTHEAIEDIAIMRALPRMTIVAPADADEMRRLMPLTVDYPGPIYIRLGKGGDPIVSSDRIPFEIGKALPMGKLQNIMTPMHKRTKRAYLPRMEDDKVNCMIKAKEYEFDYWDGDRRYGYGGYKYDGRWKSVAEKLIKEYDLGSHSKVLDVGCGKAHILYEMKLLLPDAELVGFDISRHGLADAPEGIRSSLVRYRAQDAYPYGDQHFDLVMSMGCLHNLRIFELKTALAEIQRVGKQGYVMLESYRNEQELFNLQCWALTCESFFDTAEWIWLYTHFGYTGDYEFIYFE
jgi:SAM-dependent methyltransferase